MNKEMIEEMAEFFKDILVTRAMCDWMPIKITHNYKGYAEELYNAGYRKITEPIKITTIGHGKEYGCYYADISVTGQELPQRVYFEASLFEREEIQEETAKEIYNKLIELSENPCNSQEEIYKAVFEPYGVKVEE